MRKRRSPSKRQSATSSRQQPLEPLAYFLDRCLQSALVVAALRRTGVDVRVHKDYFAEDEKDETWLPQVVHRGWIILTKDKRIRKRPIEKQALINSGARAFVLTSGNLGGQEMADIFVKHLNRIERVARNTPAPFVYAVTKTHVKQIPL